MKSELEIHNELTKEHYQNNNKIYVVKGLRKRIKIGEVTSISTKSDGLNEYKITSFPTDQGEWIPSIQNVFITLDNDKFTINMNLNDKYGNFLQKSWLMDNLDKKPVV